MGKPQFWVIQSRPPNVLKHIHLPDLLGNLDLEGRVLHNSSTKTHGCCWIFSWPETQTDLQNYLHHQLVSVSLAWPYLLGGVSWMCGGTPLNILLNGAPVPLLQERKRGPGGAVDDCVLSAKMECLGFEPRSPDTVLSETPRK